MSDLSLEGGCQAATERFKAVFGEAATFAAVAPGRVNLIGEHTDYNDGFVLPMAIDRQTWMVTRPRTDGQARIHAALNGQTASFAVDPQLEPGEPAWSNYVRGVVAGFLREGINPGGFDAVVDSTVPAGSGLSSSAALEVATATMLEQLAGHAMEPHAKALLCQWAEHQFAGMPCGIMDQFIAVMGEAGAALLIDCRSHQAQSVPMNDESIAVVIINTNVKHELVGGEYAQRRQQCEAAAKALGVAALRDADMTMLEAAKGQLDDQPYRRARHVIGENQRTLDAVAALRQGDWSHFGTLLGQSHASLRDDFEVSCDELDALVELAEPYTANGTVFGSRMTGGGFGGCTVTLARADAAERVADEIAQAYHKRVGIEASTFVSRPAAGARAVKL